MAPAKIRLHRLFLSTLLTRSTLVTLLPFLTIAALTVAAARASPTNPPTPQTPQTPQITAQAADSGLSAAAADSDNGGVRQPGAGGHSMPDMPGMPGMAGMPEAGAGSMKAMDHGAANDAMSHEHMGMGPHMKMTAPRRRTAADERRAGAIVDTLRTAIGKYRDYRVAVADGFIQYLPNIPQPMYHFTNWGYAYQAEFGFDPSRPTSLLYKPTAGGGFELVGAMYTAPQRFDEEQLDRRVPLAIAAWHQHVNICMPQKDSYRNADWHRFGFTGTIATAADCDASGGVFHPVIFGWMVHAYPFEQDPAKIWAH